MTTSSSLNLFAPIFVSMIFIALLIFRSRSSAVTMFDCAMTMLIIGIYSLNQLLNLYFRHENIKQSLASNTIVAFLEVDPTNKVKKLLSDSTTDMKAVDFSKEKEHIAIQNRAELLGSGAFVFAVMACGFGVVSLLYHGFWEKRNHLDINSTCEVCVFVVHVIGCLVFGLISNGIVNYSMFGLNNEAAVNSCLNGITQGLSQNLIQIWNTHPELRDNLRQVPNVSKIADKLTIDVKAITEDIKVLGNSMSSVPNDVRTSLHTHLQQILQILDSTAAELEGIRQKPCESGTSTNILAKSKNLKRLAAELSKIKAIKTGRADVDFLLRNLATNCLPLLTGLKDLQMMNLCDSYQTTRDILIKLEQYCAENFSVSIGPSILLENINVLVITFIGGLVLAFGAGRLLNTNLTQSFYFTLMTALALMIYQVLLIDCGSTFRSTVDDWRLLLYSASSSLG